MRNDVFQQIMTTEPLVLLFSDVATADPKDRENLVENLLTQFGEGQLLDGKWGLRFQYRKLGHPGLANQLRPFITDRDKNSVVRRVAIDIAESCVVLSLQGLLADVSLNCQEDLGTRVHAAYAVAAIGDIQTKQRLKALALDALSEDVEDDLKGCALRALWPHSLPAGELFASLTVPKRASYGGAYSRFLTSELVTGLRPFDLCAALGWLKRQHTRRELGIHFEKISDALIQMAWENLEHSMVAELFVDIVAERIRQHDKIFGRSEEDTHESQWSDSGKRRFVVERLVDRFSEKDVPWLRWCIPGTGLGDDMSWLLDRYRSCADPSVKKKWETLALHSFNPHDNCHLEAVFAETSANPTLAAILVPIIGPIELGSSEAMRQKAIHESNERFERENRGVGPALITPPPAERIEKRLRQFEEGSLGAWWHLHREMSLNPDGTHYGNNHEHDLTRLPGWKASSLEVQARFVAAAQRYLLVGDPHDDEWLGKPVWHEAAAAGYRAMLLLQREQPETMQQLDSTIWSKWAATLLVYSTESSENAALNKTLIHTAYSSAREAMIRSMITVIDAENVLYEYPTITNTLNSCWDEDLGKSVLRKCQGGKLKPKFAEALLEFLLRHYDEPARSWAVSLISNPWADEQPARPLAVAAGAAILEHPYEDGWSALWLRVQADRQFGKALIEVCNERHGSVQTAKLAEEQLGDLYVWLVATYPAADHRERVYQLRNQILNQLQSCGTERACNAIRRLMQELPDQDFLKWSLRDALEWTRRKNWEPLPPEQVLQMANDSTKRVVRDGADLLEAIIESLESLRAKLRGEIPLVTNLWDKVSRDKWKPKEEDHLSDNVAKHLEDELRGRGVVLNREVVIRRNRSRTLRGERTDICVSAILGGPEGDQLDTVTAIVEVKGSWHPELWTAMETQLVGRYLAETRARHGLYVVGWFECPQWDRCDQRKRRTETLAEATARLQKQAHDLSQRQALIKAFVLDASVR